MANNATIQTRFMLERDEFAKAYSAARRSLSWHVRWPGWIQCLLLAALVILPITYQPDDKPQALPLIMLALLWGVLLMGGVSNRGLLNLQYARMQGKEINYEFSDSGFASSMLPDGDSRLTWIALSRVLETDTLFVLIASGILFYTVPKRALATGDIDHLRKLFTDKIGSGFRSKLR